MTFPMAGADLATPLRRIGAYLLDAIVASLLIAPFLLGLRIASGWSEFGEGSLDLATFYAWGIPGYLFVMGLLIYWEGERGATPGKRVLGMRVQDVETGTVIGWRRDLVRRLMFFPEAIPVYLGCFWMFWDKRRQAWHDKVARSVVVRTERH